MIGFGYLVVMLFLYAYYFTLAAVVASFVVTVLDTFVIVKIFNTPSKILIPLFVGVIFVTLITPMELTGGAGEFAIVGAPSSEFFKISFVIVSILLLLHILLSAFQNTIVLSRK